MGGCGGVPTYLARCPAPKMHPYRQNTPKTQSLWGFPPLGVQPKKTQSLFSQRTCCEALLTRSWRCLKQGLDGCRCGGFLSGNEMVRGGEQVVPAVGGHGELPHLPKEDRGPLLRQHCHPCASPQCRRLVTGGRFLGLSYCRT